MRYKFAISVQLSLAPSLSIQVRTRLHQLYVSLGELSRHFWACFPPTTPELKTKVAEMHDTLQKFQSVRLKPFENEVARAYASMSSPLTNHINHMLEAIFRKYAAWKQKSHRMPH